MKIKFAPATTALVALDTHAGYPNLAVMSVDGPFIAFDFGEGATVDSIHAMLDAANTTIDSLVTEAQEAEESEALLVALRATVARARREALAALSYNKSAEPVEIPTDVEQESQLHTDTHAASNDSPSSNDADSKNEELKTYEQAQQGTRRKR